MLRLQRPNKIERVNLWISRDIWIIPIQLQGFDDYFKDRMVSMPKYVNIVFAFFLLYFFNFFFNVYLFLRQRETEHERGRVRERETQNWKQAPGSELSAQSRMRGSNPRTARS